MVLNIVHTLLEYMQFVPIFAQLSKAELGKALPPQVLESTHTTVYLKDTTHLRINLPQIVNLVTRWQGMPSWKSWASGSKVPSGTTHTII